MRIPIEAAGGGEIASRVMGGGTITLGERREVEPGILVTYQDHHARKAIGLEEVMRFLVETGAEKGVEVGIVALAGWILRIFKDRASRLKIGSREVDPTDEEDILEAIRQLEEREAPDG